VPRHKRVHARLDALWHAPRVPKHPNVSRRSAHPSTRGERSKDAKPRAQKRAAGTRRAVCMVSSAVRDARPHPEERAGRRRSANAKPRTRVSKDEDERLGLPSCFETHRSARRLWKHLRSSRAAMLLSMRATVARRILWPNEAKPSVCVFDPREGPTCGCGKRAPAPIHCFRIVIYNGWHNQDA
jgi:hypothetical protein